MRMQLRIDGSAREARVAEGEWVSGSFRNAYGQRAYRLYVPAGFDGQPVPLLVLLHGCTQDPADFAAGTRMNQLADRDTFLVLYPEQPDTAQQRQCWQWFEPEHQERSQGEPAIIAGLTRRIMRNYAVDPDRVYVAGLSAGGAMAVVLSTTYPDLYAAVGVHSGLAYKAGEGLLSAWVAMRLGAPSVALIGRPVRSRSIPLIVFHGDLDRIVSLANARQLVTQWLRRHGIVDGPTAAAQRLEPAFVRRGQVPGGHAYTTAFYRSADQTLVEQWTVHGLGHTWSGGSPAGSHVDPLGPDASAELVRFFSQHVKQRRKLLVPRRNSRSGWIARMADMCAGRLNRSAGLPHHRAA
jgi:poly(hydroxyalkanoate) depolymerase family esterase